MDPAVSGTARGPTATATAAKRKSTAAASKRRVTAAPLDSLQTLFGPPPKRRSTGRRRSRSGTPRQPPRPAVTVSPSDESVDSRDGRPPVHDSRYPLPTPPWEYEVDGDATDIMLPDGRIISIADAADDAFVAAAAAASAFVDDAAAAAAAAAGAFADDAASVDTSVCSERQTEWVWRSGLDVSECVDDWGWEDALAERKMRLLAEFVGEED